MGLMGPNIMGNKYLDPVIASGGIFCRSEAISILHREFLCALCLCGSKLSREEMNEWNL